MRQNTVETQELLRQRRFKFRNLLWIGARRRSNNELAQRGWWNDVGTAYLQVIDKDNVIRTRPYVGSGELMGVGDIVMAAGVTAQSVSVTLAANAATVEEAVLEWNPRFAPVEIHRAILDPATGLQTQPAVPRFIGFVNDMDYHIPEEGEEAQGHIILDCSTLSQELQRANNVAMRSYEDQLQRGGDRFYEHTATAHKKQDKWGDQDAQ